MAEPEKCMCARHACVPVKSNVPESLLHGTRMADRGFFGPPFLFTMKARIISLRIESEKGSGWLCRSAYTLNLTMQQEVIYEVIFHEHTYGKHIH